MLNLIFQEVTVFFQVVLIDLVLAGDNAVVIGLAAAGLPHKQRAKAVLVGIVVAAALRITFAVLATQLLQIVGVLLVGGILLLWVGWRIFRELHVSPKVNEETLEVAANLDINADGTVTHCAPRKSFAQAAAQIVVADISMSLDNVLAVAGAAREHVTALVLGLGMSVALIGFAATCIARLLESHRWVAYGGLLVILYVAANMIYRGFLDVWPLIRIS